MDARGTAKEVLYDFGAKPTENEPTVYYTAVRRINQLIKLFTTWEGGDFKPDSFNAAHQDDEFDDDKLYHCYQSGLKDMIYNTKLPLIHSIISITTKFICNEIRITDDHLNLFYPLPCYKERDALNEELHKQKDMEHLEFNWVPIGSFEDLSTR
jgi:hypothetical protein